MSELDRTPAIIAFTCRELKMVVENAEFLSTFPGNEQDSYHHSRWFWWTRRTLHVTAAASYPHYECGTCHKGKLRESEKLCLNRVIGKAVEGISVLVFLIPFPSDVRLEQLSLESFLALHFCGCSHDLSGPFLHFSPLSLELGQDHTPLLQKWPQISLSSICNSW